MAVKQAKHYKRYSITKFLWTILEIQRSLVQSLEKRSEIKLTEENGECTIDRLNMTLWPALKKNSEDVISCKYKGPNTTIFSLLRKGRASDDINTSTLTLQRPSKTNHLASVKL